MVHAAQSMIHSLVTSVLNLGFSLVVKNVGMRNYLNPELKITTGVSVAGDTGLFGNGVRWGLGKHWANGNTRQRRGSVWERCLCVCSLGQQEEHYVMILV